MKSVFFDVKSVECIFTQDKPPQAFLNDTEDNRYLAEINMATGGQEIVTTFDPDKHVMTGFGVVTEPGSNFSRITLFVLSKAPKGASRATREELEALWNKSLK